MMMTYFALIRHGATDSARHSISSRGPGLPLNAEGRQQVERLTEGLARLPLSAIYASPMKRTRETAEIIARTFRLSAVSNDRLAEIDYGSWTGKRFSELEPVYEWQMFNAFR